MKPFIPYEKLSKRKQREVDQQKRSTWGQTNPITRHVESQKQYDRKKDQIWRKEPPDLVFWYQ